MEIVYFIKSKKNPGVSIANVFNPIISQIDKRESVTVFYLPYERFNLKSVLGNLLFVYKHRTRKGINHVTGEVHYCILALFGCKSVLTVHDLSFWTVDPLPLWKKIILYVLNLYLPIKLAKHVITISEFTKQEVCQSVSSNLSKLSVIPTATIDHFVRTPKILDKNNIVILQNGVRPNKNLETTIKALEGIPCLLRVIRKMTKEQSDLADRLGVNYENLYDLTNDEIVKSYQDSDIVVFPTLYEGFGVITIEAQAVGRPVITTNKEPMRSVACGGAYLLENPLDVQELRMAILKIINDVEYSNMLISEGFKNVKKYTLDSVVANHLELYDKLCKKNKNR